MRAMTFCSELPCKANEKGPKLFLVLSKIKFICKRKHYYLGCYISISAICMELYQKVTTEPSQRSPVYFSSSAVIEPPPSVLLWRWLELLSLNWLNSAGWTLWWFYLGLYLCQLGSLWHSSDLAQLEIIIPTGMWWY